jgi:hypothetical protein
MWSRIMDFVGSAPQQHIFLCDPHRINPPISSTANIGFVGGAAKMLSRLIPDMTGHEILLSSQGQPFVAPSQLHQRQCKADQSKNPPVPTPHPKFTVKLLKSMFHMHNFVHFLCLVGDL